MDKENLIQNLEETIAKLASLVSSLKEPEIEHELKFGPHSDGFYKEGGIDSSYTEKTPQQAKDDGLWYSYSNGVSEQAHYHAHDSNYSNYAFWAGSINTAGYNPVPSQAWDNGKWYTYAAGAAVEAEGAYSNGAYVAGELDLEGKHNGEQIAQDDGSTRSYQNGLIVLL
jgi:hypothetical protein